MVYSLHYAIAQPLEAHWDFNGNGSMSTLTDVTGYGHDGAVVNCASVPGCDGNPNGALEFFGPGSYVQVPSSLSFCMDEWTINAVVKINTFNNNSSPTCQWSTILSKDPRGTIDAYSLEVGNRLTWGVCTGTPGIGQVFCADNGGSGVAIPSGIPVNLGQWYCFTAINRPNGGSSSIELYLNGVFVTSYTLPRTFNAGACPPLDLFIGKGSYLGLDIWFNGAIDDIQIYRNAIPASMVPVYFSCPCGNPPPPPPNDCQIKDIYSSSSYYSPFVRSFSANVSPSFKWVRWKVNGAAVTALPSTSPFVYTFPSGGTYTICGYVFDPVTRVLCDSLCFETCISEHGHKPGRNDNDSKVLTPHYPNNGLLEKTVDKVSVGELYPNPTDATLNVPITGYAGSAGIAISTVDGKTAFSRNYTVQTGGKPISADIKLLPPGVYFIEISLGAETIRRKFTKL